VSFIRSVLFSECPLFGVSFKGGFIVLCIFHARVDLEKFLGGKPNKVSIKVAHLNALLTLQLRTSLVISQLPV